MERDEFDSLDPVYLLERDLGGAVRGCVRLLPSVGPTMLRDVFPSLLDGRAAPASPTIWESSRFAHDPDLGAPKAGGGLAKTTFELFAGMIEFGLSRDLTHIVTVTDTRIERILRRAAWPLQRLGQPQSIGSTLAVAGYLEVSPETHRRVTAGGNLTPPVLWAPVIQSAA